LWVYDARTEEVTTRVLVESPPFDSPAAAAVALSIKTVLRASVVAPETERFGANATPPLRRADRFTWDTGADFYFFAPAKWEPRITFGGTIWATAGRHVGLGLALSAGPGVSLESATFLGRYREIAIASDARWRVFHGDTFSVCLLAGTTAHASTFDGTLEARATRIEVHRVNLSFDAGGRFDLSLGGGAFVGASAHASYLASYQRYLVVGQPVFSLWPVSATVGGHFGVDLF
jgi:hypothetical protein